MPSWARSKTFIFGIICLAVLTGVFVTGTVVWLVTDEEIPFLDTVVQGILGILGIVTARNVVTDGIKGKEKT